MALRLPPPGPDSSVGGLMGIDREALGIPTEEQYVAAYCRCMGIDNWNFYLGISFFSLAAIAQGVARRAADGSAASKSANAVGAMVQPLAALALDVVA